MQGNTKPSAEEKKELFKIQAAAREFIVNHRHDKDLHLSDESLNKDKLQMVVEMIVEFVALCEKQKQVKPPAERPLIDQRVIINDLTNNPPKTNYSINTSKK